MLTEKLNLKVIGLLLSSLHSPTIKKKKVLDIYMVRVTVHYSKPLLCKFGFLSLVYFSCFSHYWKISIYNMPILPTTAPRSIHVSPKRGRPAYWAASVPLFLRRLFRFPQMVVTLGSCKGNY